MSKTSFYNIKEQFFIDLVTISYGAGYILSTGYSSVSHATHSPRRLAEEPSERSIRCLAFTSIILFLIIYEKFLTYIIYQDYRRIYFRYSPAESFGHSI